MKEELNRLRESMDSLTSRVAILEKENVACKKCRDELLQKQMSLSMNFETMKSSVDRINTDLSLEILTEVESRLNRRSNLIVRGLPELQTGSLNERKIHDADKIQNMLGFLSQDDAATRWNANRIGRLA